MSSTWNSKHSCLEGMAISTSKCFPDSGFFIDANFRILEEICFLDQMKEYGFTERRYLLKERFVGGLIPKVLGECIHGFVSVSRQLGQVN